ncbi:MAG: hypothetical protein E6H58_11855 [Betaproteobacteria bacterium]|nr:MAG: hypothetical protein E6H65_14495 [Betaproteobacteria bacterium]TMH31576.1 MAG: hypothetical protein E6H58_11855 [Betaproteobacteria bacterium]
MVSLFAFVMTAYGLNPYLIASFNSGFACENAKTQILTAALEQTTAGSSTYSMTPRSLKCIATPGLVAGGTRPPDIGSAQKAAAAQAAKKPVKK